jgi:hypothetical protein
MPHLVIGTIKMREKEDNNNLVNQPSSIIFSSLIDNSKSPSPYSKDILSSLLLSKEKPL